jgi:thiol-disulfide isomerase/thioredoxin
MSHHEHDLEFDDLESLVPPAVVEALEEVLAPLDKEVEILVFVAPGCSACPHQVRTVAALTLANPNISVEIVDATQEPEFAAQYDVRSVPTTVVDDELILVGVKHPQAMAEILLARGGPDGEQALMASLLESGRVEDAAERLLYGPDPEATRKVFVDLWSRSTLQDRMGMTLVVEHALDLEREGLDGAVPLFVAGLEGEGPLSHDPARRGDTAAVLGMIGHPDAREVLEVLSRDPNEEVAEAAADALEELA